MGLTGTLRGELDLLELPIGYTGAGRGSAKTGKPAIHR